MMKGEQQKVFHKGSNRKINAFITLLYPLNKIKFKISKSRTSADFINHLRNIGNYIKKNKIKRFILVTDNATFHVSRKTKQFIENQLHWLTVIFLYYFYTKTKGSQLAFGLDLSYVVPQSTQRLHNTY
jgi:hypothetical protein